jgi:hypothetical protein
LEGINSDNDDARERLARIESLNPRLAKQVNAPLGRSQPIVLPDNIGGKLSGVNHAEMFTKRCITSDACNLAAITSDIGGQNTLALAAVANKYDLYSKAADLNTFGGGGLGAGTVRASGFLQALAKYDEALAKYESFRNHRAVPATLRPLELKAKQAFSVLQVEFNRETKMLLQSGSINTQVVPLNTANSRTVSRSIPLTDFNSVQSLSRFARYGKGLGYGLVGLDGYFRYQQVKQRRMMNGNWQREAWMQGVGFGTGLVVGAVTFAMLLGPFGIVLGIVAAGMAAVMVDKMAVYGTGLIYDQFHR